MKKFLNFVVYSFINALLIFRSSATYAHDTFYGVSTARPQKIVNILIVCFSIINIFSAFILSTIFFKRKFKKFDYKSNYKKFKEKDKIKVTFIDKNGKIVTKRCRITSIDGKKIVFEDKTNTYKCTPSDIKSIKKKSKTVIALIIMFFLSLIALLMAKVVDYAIR